MTRHTLCQGAFCDNFSEFSWRNYRTSYVLWTDVSLL